MIITNKIVVKLINFPVMNEYIELDESGFCQLIKENIVIIDNIKFQVLRKQVSKDNELEIEFEKIL